MSARPRKELRIEDLTALCDSREQLPLDLSPLKVERASLPTGDYSLKGLEHVIAVERKSLQDLLMCIGRERDRFEREIQRLLAYPCRAIFVETSQTEFKAGAWRSKVSVKAAEASLYSWMGKGVPIWFAGTAHECGLSVARFMYLEARRRWRELQGLTASLKIVGGE